MGARRILIVEDEAAIRAMLVFGLKRAGFEITEAADAHSARNALADARPDLMLVDWMLPDGTGLELTRSLKRDRAWRDLPIILLTARAAEADKIAGLDGGADDYITKPFSPRELHSRINALLRRAGVADDDELVTAGVLALNRATHRLTASGQSVLLGPTEFRLLEFFMTHAERVYSREQLLDRVWGGSADVELRTVDVQVRRLRKALEAHGADGLLQTVRGSGYRLSTRPESES